MVFLAFRTLTVLLKRLGDTRSILNEKLATEVYLYSSFTLNLFFYHSKGLVDFELLLTKKKRRTLIYFNRAQTSFYH